MCSADPGSEFVVANTLAKWKSGSQMTPTLAKALAKKVNEGSFSIFLIWCSHFRKSKS